MENNIKVREGIIEFYGIPGSGKTTLMKEMAMMLESDGYSVQKKIYEINNEYSNLIRMCIKSLSTLLFTFNNFRFMCFFFSNVKIRGINKFIEIFKQWINISFVLTFMNRSNDCDYVLVDQGIIQAIISISSHNKISHKLMYGELLGRINLPIQFIYVNTEIENVLNRLDNRQNGKSRAEKINDMKVRKEYLERIQKECLIMESLIKRTNLPHSKM